MEKDNRMSIFVLSCDKYSDVWDYFFMAKEQYWKDCKYDTYLVTERKSYNRDGVKVLNFEGDWSTRLRKAAESVNSKYICIYLEDSLIHEPINNQIIEDDIDFAEKNHVDFFNLEDPFDVKAKIKDKEYVSDHIYKIPAHTPYGVDTAAAMWDREYLIKMLGTEDYNAWKFEMIFCDLAKTEEGTPGVLLCDDRKPLNVTPVPVVIFGRYFPPAIKYFKKKGIIIKPEGRGVMSYWDVFLYRSKQYFSGATHGRKILKWIGHNIFGLDFVSKD